VPSAASPPSRTPPPSDTARGWCSGRTPGKDGISAACDAATAGSKPGLTVNMAPASTESITYARVRTVPAPTMAPPPRPAVAAEDRHDRTSPQHVAEPVPVAYHSAKLPSSYVQVGEPGSRRLRSTAARTASSFTSMPRPAPAGRGIRPATGTSGLGSTSTAQARAARAATSAPRTDRAGRAPGRRWSRRPSAGRPGRPGRPACARGSTPGTC
jgi:hypothetical protein